MVQNSANNNHISSLFSDLSDGNRFIGYEPELENSNFFFEGKNNVLCCEEGVVIKNSKIFFKADNSLVFLKKGVYCFFADIYNDSVLHIGENNYFNPSGIPFHIIASEHKNVFIGNNNLFSFGTSIRTADPHLIYDIESKKRVNNSKSCYIGDHIWIGQNVLILKGTNVQTGSVIGAGSVVASKKLKSNSVYVGSPAKLIRKNIYWSNKCTHSWTQANTDEAAYISEEEFVYKHNKNVFVSFGDIEKELNKIPSAFDKVDYLKNLTQDKNRFTDR